MKVFNSFQEVLCHTGLSVGNILSGNPGKGGSSINAQFLSDLLEDGVRVRGSWEKLKQKSAVIPVVYGINGDAQGAEKNGTVDLNTGQWKLEDNTVVQLPGVPVDMVLSVIDSKGTFDAVRLVEGLVNDFIDNNPDKTDLRRTTYGQS